MQQTAKNGGLILMHAENGLAIDVVAAQNVEAGNTDPYYHGVSRSPGHGGRGDEPRHPAGAGRRRARLHRPPVARSTRSTRCVGPATRGCRPTPRPARSTSSSRSRTWATASRAPSSSARRRCAPPSTRGELWKGLAKDDLQVVSTDHCPFDFHGQKDLGKGDFRKVPNGLAGRRGSRQPAPLGRRRRRPPDRRTDGSR